MMSVVGCAFFFFQAEDGIRDFHVTGVQTCALPICVKLKRLGAHCLRHACASQLLEAGFTLKQIADHLGHRSMNSTRIYTKIDLHGLREVAEFDLGALL